MEKFKLQYRFDFGSKYFYVKCFINNIKCSFYKKQYHELIKTFNNCWEYPGTKTKIEDFYNSFDLLIENIKKNGFNENEKIPLGSNGIIINGSHRLITSLFLGKTPLFKIEKEAGHPGYIYSFFLNRVKFKNLNINITDFISLNNIELISNFEKNNKIRSIIIHPNAVKKNKINELEDILNKNGKIIYKKELRLSKKGYLNLVIELYRGETWVGGLFQNSKNQGIAKVTQCYTNENLIYYSYYINESNKDIMLKKKLRDIYNIDKSSVHSTDNYEDTFRTASSLLNNNSIYFLEKGVNFISTKTRNFLEKYFSIVKGDDFFCVTSSVILELFGLRTANDLDFVFINNNNDKVRKNKVEELKKNNINPHTRKWLNYYPTNIDSLIFDPQNYFYINGHKFMSINYLKEMKNKRNEPKDIVDISLINKII